MVYLAVVEMEEDISTLSFGSYLSHSRFPDVLTVDKWAFSRVIIILEEKNTSACSSEIVQKELKPRFVLQNE